MNVLEEKDINEKENKEENKVQEKQRLLFTKLTPINDAELSVYKEALDFAFEESDVKNLAVSGAYGSGKSSIIETYKQNTIKKIMHISLAHFDNELENNHEISPKNLEGKVINQLIHQIDSEKIPLTNFKIKKDKQIKIRRNTLISYTVLVALAIINFKYDNWVNLIKEFNIEFITKLFINGWMHTLLIIALLILFSLKVKTLIEKMYAKGFLKKITSKNFEIQMFEDDPSSFFDKYLNEILYVFENSDADAIVFEDIDRFENNEIFEKLREINTLINNKLIIQEKKMLFIYMVKDDMFLSKDRTKFFDFIIPIIPVIDSSNSFDKFVSNFKEAGFLSEFNDKFLSDVSLYVDDYRLLKNIYNEFTIYRLRLNKSDLDMNKLLSMIIYKNLFPKDFSDLQLNKGYVKTIFLLTDELIEDFRVNLKDQIKYLQKQIDAIVEEELDDIDHLDAQYLVLSEKIRINGVEASDYESNIDLIKDLKNSDNTITIQKLTSAYSSYYNVSWDNFSYLNLFDDLHKNAEYEERYQKIISKHDGRLNEFNKELSLKEFELINIENMSFKELMQGNVQSGFFELTCKKMENIYEDVEIIRNNCKTVLNSDYLGLLKYLIINDYINRKNYFDYISYFYPNSITQNDKSFLRGIIEDASLPLDYKLDSVTKVEGRLSNEDFNKDVIMNFDLFSFLLFKGHKSYCINLDIFLKNVVRNRRIDFINQFIKTGRNLDFLMISMFKDNYDFLDYIIDTTRLSVEDKEYIVLCIVFLTKYELSQKAKKYISERNYFLSKTEIKFFREEFGNEENQLSDQIDLTEQKINDKQYLGDRYSRLEIKFENIKYKEVDSKLFELIYNSNSYKINVDHIITILTKIYGVNCEKNLTKISSLVFSDKKTPLYKYIKKNMNIYIQAIIAGQFEEITDSENDALEIINDNSIDNITVQEYIKLLSTEIKSLKEIANFEFWKNIIDSKCIENSDDNIMIYYAKHGMDETLISLINNKTDEYSLTGEKIDSYEGVSSKDFFADIIKCNGVIDKQYKSLLNINYKYYPEFSIANIESSKFKILVELNIVRMNIKTLDFVRKNYASDLLEFLILNNKKEYIDIIKGDKVDYDELLYILKHDDFNEKEKLQLLNFAKETINYCTSYSNRVKKHILENNLDISDIDIISKNYNHESNKVKEIIIDIINENISYIISNEIVLSFSILKELIKKGISIEVKKSVIFLAIEILSFEEAHKIFNQIDKEFAKIFSRKQASISGTVINKNILEKFKDKGWINSYATDRYDTSKYRTYYSSK